MRLYDLQAQTRARSVSSGAISGAQRLLLLVNDTAANRRVLRAYPEYLD